MADRSISVKLNFCPSCATYIDSLPPIRQIPPIILFPIVKLHNTSPLCGSILAEVDVSDDGSQREERHVNLEFNNFQHDEEDDDTLVNIEINSGKNTTKTIYYISTDKLCFLGEFQLI